MNNLIDKGTIVERIDDLFFDNYPNPSKDLETFYKEVLKIVINAKPQNNWISVKDRLPQQYRDVIVFYDDIKRVGVNWLDSHNEFMFYKDMNITYWMPLPEPPESEDDVE